MSAEKREHFAVWVLRLDGCVQPLPPRRPCEAAGAPCGERTFISAFSELLLSPSGRAANSVAPTRRTTHQCRRRERGCCFRRCGCRSCRRHACSRRCVLRIPPAGLAPHTARGQMLGCRRAGHLYRQPRQRMEMSGQGRLGGRDRWHEGSSEPQKVYSAQCREPVHAMDCEAAGGVDRLGVHNVAQGRAVHPDERARGRRRDLRRGA